MPKDELTRTDRERLAGELLEEFTASMQRIQAKYPPETDEDIADDAEFLAELLADTDRLIRDRLNLH